MVEDQADGVGGVDPRPLVRKPRQLIGTAAVAAIIGVVPETINGWVKDGKIRPWDYLDERWALFDIDYVLQYKKNLDDLAAFKAQIQSGG